MECFCGSDNTIDIITVIFTTIGTIGTLVIGIITVVNLLKYIQKKRIDALYGFYTRLYWFLNLLDKCIGLNETNKVSVLYFFSENNELKTSVVKSQIEDFEYCLNGIIELLCKNDNQVSIQTKYCSDSDVNSFEENLNKLFDLLYKFKNSNGIPIYAASISKQCIDKITDDIRNIIKSLMQVINKAKG